MYQDLSCVDINDVVERLFMVELRCYKCGQSNGVRTTGVGLATDSWDGNYKCSENGDGNYMVDCTGSCWVRNKYQVFIAFYDNPIFCR